MPTLGQKVDLLFKKFLTQKSTVNKKVGNIVDPAQFDGRPYYSEYFGSKQTVTASQIWTQSKYIPLTSNPLNKNAGVNNTLRVLGTAGALYNDVVDAATNPDRPVLLVDGNRVLERVDLLLQPVAGSKWSWAFAVQTNASGSTDWVIGNTEWVKVWGPLNLFPGYNIVPFSFDATATLYVPQLFKNKTASADSTWGTTYTLSNEITFLDPSDWFFDQDALVLNFMGETWPSAVDDTTPLYIRVYRYIGKVGEFGGTDTTALSASIGYIEDVSTATELDTVLAAGATSGTGLHNAKDTLYAYVSAQFSHANGPSGVFSQGSLLKYNTLLSKWEISLVGDGGRFLARAEDITHIKTYVPSTNVYNADNTVVKNSILEYWDAAKRGSGVTGFVATYPSADQRISISLDANKIWLFNGTEWIVENISSSKGSLSNKDMVANVTGKVVTGTGPTATVTYNLQAVNPTLLDTPSGSGYIEVQVNGVAIKLGDGYTDTPASAIPSACFAKPLTSYTATTTGATIKLSFSGTPIPLVTNDQVAFITNTGDIKVATVTLSGTDVTIPSTFAVTGSPQMYKLRKYSTIAAGDILVWFGANAKYELDADDRVSYIFVSPA